MATVKQKLVLQKTVENGGNVTKAMREVGYREATINNPSNLTRSKGFLGLCDNMGLTEDFLLSALVQDIKTKKGTRKAELELGFKIRGRLSHKVELIGTKEKSIELSEKEKAEIDRVFQDFWNQFERKK